MHVRTSFQDLLPLIFGPNHKSIHRSLDMLSRISLPLGLPDDLGAVPLGVLLLLLPLPLAPELAVLGGAGGGGAEGGEGGLGQARRLEPGGVLEELQVRQLGEGRPGEVLEEAARVPQTCREPEGLVKDGVVSL